ncbi:class I SAM-dependent methyltransferase [Methylosarcina fibrata]|uniref:class I SAM-dependent methyltransferase n=1 Tax=Methylosarcina fibrata TaxID=105972 RepID=UPI0003765B4B|nr:methyltransferase domain-containing protein [Methylosarcina fibrata]
MTKQPHFIPALHFHWLTPYYDFFIEKTFPVTELNACLLQEAEISPGDAVLEVGCGTGTLALLVKRSAPDAAVAALDVDARILAIARRKALAAGLAIGFQQGSASRLPYPDNRFDRVLSGFTFHHLTDEDKRHAAAEAFRVLRPGGEFHLLDFGKPYTLYGRLVSWALRWTEEMDGNVRGLLPDRLRAAGFAEVEERRRFSTLSGSVSLYRGRKPG